MRTFLAPYLLLLPALLLVKAASHAADQAELLQQQAIQRIDGFVDHFRTTGDRVTRLPQLQQAERELIASYRAFMGRGDLAAGALSLIKLGDARRMLNRADLAFESYREAENLAKRASHPPHQVKALLGLAKVEFLMRRNLGAATALIEQAIQVSAQIADRKYLFEALDFQGEIQVARGDLVGASDTLNRAFSLAAGLNDKPLLFYGYLDRAEVYQKLAEKCDYQRTFAACYEVLALSKADYERALRIAQELGWSGLARQTQGFLQRLEMRRQLIQSQERFHAQVVQAGIFRPRKAEDVLVQDRFLAGSQPLPAGLLAFAQQIGGFAGAGDARSAYIQGLFHEMQGENDRALAAYLKAVERLEVDRRNLRDEQSRGSFLEDKIDFYYTPALHLLERRRFAEAFELLERSRSRALADLLATKPLALPGGQDRTDYAESLRLKARIALLQKEMYADRMQADRDQSAARIAAAEREIQRLEEEHRALLQRLAAHAPKLQGLLVSQPVPLQRVQQGAREDRYQVLYYLAQESGLIVWLIGGDAVHVRSVFLPRSELITKVAQIRKGLADPRAPFDQQTARELFLFLIEPMRRWITTDHLVIVPHEDLFYLPFQVLQNPADGSYLGERVQISYAPSATVLAALRKVRGIAGASVLAVADPDLGHAVDEVDAIGRLYAGRSRIVKDVLASEADVKAWAGQYSLLHFSVHGIFEAKEPLLSYLKLRQGGQEDGRLTAAEMFGLPLEKATLVVLSACDTGRAGATHANEVLGMVRALLYAGTNTLVLSSWKVEAESTAVWMKTFYQEGQAVPLSEAGRAALLAVKQQPKFSHPYYWGAFLMVGK